MNLLFSDQPAVVDDNMIFLAGPTSRTNDYDLSWRKEMAELFKQNGFQGTLCIPEFYNKRPFTDDDWLNQVDWEWTLLDNAKCILFWVPRHSPDMMGLTTNLEFGTYLQKCPERVVLAYPNDAEHMEWMKLKYERVTGRNPVHTMYEAVCKAVEMARPKMIEQGFVGLGHTQSEALDNAYNKLLQFLEENGVDQNNFSIVNRQSNPDYKGDWSAFIRIEYEP